MVSFSTYAMQFKEKTNESQLCADNFQSVSFVVVKLREKLVTEI
jgi:hypothetical protein